MISKSRIKYVRSLELKKNRMADKVFVAEGRKLVADIIDFFEPVYIAATEEWMTDNSGTMRTLCGKYSAMSHDVVTEDELRRISLLETPQQVLVVFRQHMDYLPMSEAASANLCLALDGVQNPGNLGTIMRVADWFGIEHIYCSSACADIYNPKTVQATMGALARVRVHYVDLPGELASLTEGTPVYGTFLDGENMYAKNLKSVGVVVMGNEGRGISAEVERYVSERIFIPNYPADRPTSESLNVAIATAIVCGEFRRISG